MIGYISGKLVDKNETSILIDVNGVGFEIGVSQNTMYSLGEIGNIVSVYTYLHVRENEISLYGFANKQEKSMFLLLTSVSGIGPKMGMGILSSISLTELTSAIMTGDSKLLSRIKGLGKKTAERIILELREKMHEVDPNNLPLMNTQPELTELPMQDALLVLTSLGITKAEAVKLIRKNAVSTDSAEDIVSKVLRNMN